MREFQLIALSGVLLASAGPAFGQERVLGGLIDLERLRARLVIPTESTESEREAEQQSYLALREAIVQELKRNETTRVAAATDGAAIVGRCAEGYVTGRRIETSAGDVEIVSEESVDCDRAGCKALQVNAVRPSSEPFSLSISVSCAS